MLLRARFTKMSTSTGRVYPPRLSVSLASLDTMLGSVGPPPPPPALALALAWALDLPLPTRWCASLRTKKASASSMALSTNSINTRGVLLYLSAMWLRRRAGLETVSSKLASSPAVLPPFASVVKVCGVRGRMAPTGRALWCALCGEPHSRALACGLSTEPPLPACAERKAEEAPAALAPGREPRLKVVTATIVPTLLSIHEPMDPCAALRCALPGGLLAFLPTARTSARARDNEAIKKLLQRRFG
mmetsp:Transcript_19430/g.40903  ORF Transcript_19430/g.40903 Transcript_19430/m.40903 type:complete len:246 (-) Transcript_19430:4-741(-)